jgi:GNAT superfamily N-acetyltransferase
MAITIRDATSDDHEVLCALVDEVDALHRERMPEIFRKPAGPVRERAYIDGLLDDENAGVFLALVDGQPAGALFVLVREAPPIPILVPRRVAIIDSLVVSEPFRRLGVGRALMDTAEAWAAQRGAAAVELSVFEFNRQAIDFYDSLGYTTVNRRMAKPLRRE